MQLARGMNQRGAATISIGRDIVHYCVQYNARVRTTLKPAIYTGGKTPRDNVNSNIRTREEIFGGAVSPPRFSLIRLREREPRPSRFPFFLTAEATTSAARALGIVHRHRPIKELCSVYIATRERERDVIKTSRLIAVLRFVLSRADPCVVCFLGDDCEKHSRFRCSRNCPFTRVYKV